MIQLRKYQTESINLLREGFHKYKRQILCLPTGSGKSVIFSDMVRQAYQKGSTTLVLTDRLELCDQTLKHIAHHQIPTQVLNADSKHFDNTAPVTLAMVETMKRRMKKWAADYKPKLIILDEAHKSSFNRIMDTYPDASVIGATATPIGKHLYKYYQNIVQNIDIPELIQQGYLSPCRAFMMQDNFDDIPVRHGEFVEKNLFEKMNKLTMYKGVIEKWKEKCNGSKTLVFNINIAHSIAMCDEFNHAGIESRVIHSETPMDERHKILEDFALDKFPVLNNCSILTCGFDLPSIETIIVNRATLSLTLWLQMQGRGSRPYPDKKYFTCLDFGMNNVRHDIWQTARTWELKPPRKKKKGDAPVRICPKCDALLHARIMVCPYCGYIFAEKPREYKDGVMVEVKPNRIPIELKGKKLSMLTVNELVALAKTGLYGKPFIWRVVRSKGERAIDDFGWWAGYAPGWAWHQKKEIKDCSYRDLTL